MLKPLDFPKWIEEHRHLLKPPVGNAQVWEDTRPEGVKDGFEWYCLDCHALLYRVEVQLKSIVRDLPPLFEQFYASDRNRSCGKCGAVHPGKG